MTTLIAVYNSDGCVGRCDARCYEAKGGTCDCIFGGRNHGAGRAAAMRNTQEMGQRMIDEWNQTHPDAQYRFEAPAAQRSLLDMLA